MRKHLLAAVLPVAALVLIGAGCSYGPGGTATTVSEGSLLDLLPEAEAVVQEKHPDAVFVSANNSDVRFHVNDYVLPGEKRLTDDGTSAYWVFVFAKNADALSDGEVDESEAASVLFWNDKLKLGTPEGVIGADAFEGVTKADIAVDSDEAIAKLAEGVETELGSAPDFQHAIISLVHTEELIPDEGQEPQHWLYDITLFSDNSSGWSGFVDASDADAEPTGVGTVEFSQY